MTSREMSRRVFLARIGVLGAGAAILPQCTVLPGGGALETEAIDLGRLIELLRPVLADLSRDTLNGFVAFSVPGRDPYSSAQGTPRGERGRHRGRRHRLPDRQPRPLPAASPTISCGRPRRPLSWRCAICRCPCRCRSRSRCPRRVLGDVEEALLFILANDDTVPLSLPVALLLNFVGTVADPLSLEGPFLSPFARLSFAEKARALEMIEAHQPRPGRAARRATLPEPLKRVGVGPAAFVGGALHRVRRLRLRTASRRSTTPAAAR